MTSKRSLFRRAVCTWGTTLLLGSGACAHRTSSEAPTPAADAAPHHGHGGHHGGMPHRFENAEEWVKRFEEPGREAWQKPDEVVKALGLAADAKVADIGAGTGYFAVRLARAVPQGRVYGVDLEPDMVRYMGERAQREGLSNLTPVLASAEDARLPEPVDLVLIVDTYHHVGERVAWLQRLAEKLRPGGRVAIVDFRVESSMGPPPAHKLSPERVREEFEAAGYRQAQTLSFLPEQYFLVFQHQTP
ncbi:class I SAM-dependent methyltransferase [Cystobacter fuscus]|uniref:class I SAM-dependent methyltransferase n=1 Tax=Cystobacter fuscus TaxID=43 RepID=UPI002B2D70CE|nr:class I SAM-dependent methyltransferase [Cystobacter fuscus]